MFLRKTIITGSAVAAILGGGGLALAAGTASAPQDTACVSGSNVVEHVYAHTASCPDGQTAIRWNQQGPAGPQGATGKTGATGAQGPQGPAGPAGASAVETVSASTNVTAWPESGGWATDAFTRSVTVTVQHAAASAKCGGTPVCYFFTGELTDNGTFQTVAGAASPNGSSSAKIAGVLDGTLQGTATFEGYASSNQISAANVPTTADGSSKPASTTDWGTLAFANGTTFAGVSLTAYGWTYNAPSTCETWVDQINPGDDGQGSADGNITGVNACTS